MRKVIAILSSMVLLCTGCTVEKGDKLGEAEFETNIIQFEVEPNEGQPRYNAIVEVKNTGDEAFDLGYSVFMVRDSDGKLVDVESSSAIRAYPSIVYPGESGYYFAGRLELPDTVDTSKSYTLEYETNHIRTTKTDNVKDYEVKDVSLPDNDYTEMIGEVINNSDSGTVDVLCICYDKDENIVTMGGTVTGFDGDKDAFFDIINLAAWGRDNIADYKIIARSSEN